MIICANCRRDGHDSCNCPELNPPKVYTQEKVNSFIHTTNERWRGRLDAEKSKYVSILEKLSSSDTEALFCLALINTLDIKTMDKVLKRYLENMDNADEILISLGRR